MRLAIIVQEVKLNLWCVWLPGMSLAYVKSIGSNLGLAKIITLNIWDIKKVLDYESLSQRLSRRRGCQIMTRLLPSAVPLNFCPVPLMQAIKRFLSLESSTPAPFDPASLSNAEYEGPLPPYETLESPDAKVYVTWDPRKPPSRPTEPGWTRFICISDTHSRIFPIPDGDILIHAEDLTHSVRCAID